MVSMRRLSVLFVLAMILSAFKFAGDGPDARHLHLLRSEPAADTVVNAMPTAVNLWFSEPPEVKVTTVKLTMPGGETVALARVTADEEDASHVVAAVEAGAGPGAYKVEWRTMSRDGHVVNGDLSFHVQPAN